MDHDNNKLTITEYVRITDGVSAIRTLVDKQLASRIFHRDLSLIYDKLHASTSESLVKDPDYNSSLAVVHFLSVAGLDFTSAFTVKMIQYLLQDGRVEAYLNSQKYLNPSPEHDIHFKIVNGMIERATTGHWPEFLWNMGS